MIVPILLFILGLILLIKGGDWFVDGASSIARRFKVPEILIGATIVSIGTTLPEVMVSTTSAIEGLGGMAYGNAVGSVICNTALISALTIAIKPGKTEKHSLKLPLLFFFVSAVFFALNAYILRNFSRITGIILLLFFVAYTILSIILMKKHATTSETAAEQMDDAQSKATADGDENSPDESEKQHVSKCPVIRFYKGNSLAKDIVFLIIGAALIAVGARLLVDNGTLIAEKLGVPDTVIALTFVALGTSLPELVTAITSLIKGHSNLSLGNIIGANLFNIILVSGASAAISPFAVPAESTVAGHPASLVVDIPVMFAVMLILAIPPLLKGKLYRAQGIVLLLIYIAFCVFQFVG